MSPRTSQPSTMPTQGAFFSFQLSPSTAPTDSVPVDDPFHQSLSKRPPPTTKKSLVVRIKERIDILEESVKSYCSLIDSLPSSKASYMFSPDTSESDENSTESTDKEQHIAELISPSTITLLSRKLPTKITIQHTPTYFSLPKHLVSIFFTLDEYFALPRILDIPQFFNTDSTRPSFLLNAMYALASQYSPHPDLLSTNSDCSQYFYQLSLSEIILENHFPSLELIQALMILSVVDLTRGYTTKGHLRIGEAVRLAQILRYHEIDQVDCNAFDHLSEIEKDRIRQIWNVIVRLDYGTSQFIDRPNFVGVPNLPKFRTIQSYSNTQLVTYCKSQLPSPLKMYNQHLMELVKIMWDISKFANPPELQLNDGFIEEIYRGIQTIDQWYNKLPKLLRYQKKVLLNDSFQQSSFSQKVIMLYVIYHSAKIYTHLFLLTKSEYVIHFPTMLSMAYNAVISCDGISRILKDYVHVHSKPQGVKIGDCNTSSELDDPPPFPSSYCYYSALCYISVLKYIKLVKSYKLPYYQPSDSCPIYLVLNEQNVTKKFHSVIRVMNRFKTKWEGAQEFVPKLTQVMESIQTDAHSNIRFNFENEAIWGGYIDPWKFMPTPN